jgi:hypothetical protein
MCLNETAPVNERLNREEFCRWVGRCMENYQWFLLGLMAAWTPGLLVLALLLRRHNIDQDYADSSGR